MSKKGLLHHTLVEISHSVPVNRNSVNSFARWSITFAIGTKSQRNNRRFTMQSLGFWLAVEVRQVIALHPKSAIETRSFCARECLLCKLTVRADYSCTRSAESSVLWFYLSFRTLLHSLSVGQFIDFRIKLKKWIMTQFNKGPAYGLSAEVKNKVNWTLFLCF